MTAPVPIPLPITPADHYWLVDDRPGEVYASARAAFVALTDPAYLAWLASGVRTVSRIRSEAELRELLNDNDVPFQSEALPPREVERARLARARVRVVAGSFVIQNATPRSIPWTAYPQSGTAAKYDPLGMWGGPAPAATPERIIIRQPGVYRFVLGIRFLEPSAGAGGTPNTGVRAVGLYLGTGGSPTDLATVKLPAAPSPADFTAFQVIEYTDEVSADSVLRAFCEQRCGGTLPAVARLSLIKEG